jgi:predicted Zn-dependent peptidase
MTETITRKLDTGLTVILRQVPNKVVTLDAWVGAGSACEDDTINGVSHFLEHMLFKGTEKYGPGELDKAITGVGGVWNAGTSKDYTHYYVTVAAPFLDIALDAISDMLQRPTLDAAEFDREKQVILEEYRRKQDDPSGVLYDTLYETAFERSPYRRTVLGTSESISGLTRDTLADYYRCHYTPENMTFMVIGDMAVPETLSKVESAFAGFVGNGSPPIPVDTVTRPALDQRVVHAMDINETYLAISLPAPGIDAPDDCITLDVAATILGDGRSSRLYRVIQEEKQLVHAISAGIPTHRHPAFFDVVMILDREKADGAVEAAVQLVRDLAETPPTPAELARAQRIITNQMYFRMERNSGQTEMIGYFYNLTGSHEYLDSYLERVRATTPDDITAAVRKYLLAGPNVVRVEPRTGEKPK